MKFGGNLAAVAAARFYAPLLVLFALLLLAGRDAGSGVGFVAGMAAGLALIAHALVFGAATAREAAPPLLMRGLLAFGLVAVVVGASLPGLVVAPQLVEAGLFALTVSACSLATAALFGRAPALRDEAQ